MSQENPTPAEIAEMEAKSFIHFYRSQTKPGDVLELTANTYLLRQVGKELGLDLLSRADVQYCADYLGASLARIKADVSATQEPAAPSYEEKVSEYRTKLESADPTSLRKIALVTALRNGGYNKDQISVELRARNFSPLTDNEIELLSPPEPTENDVRAVEKSAADEVSAASQRIGALLVLGHPATRSDIINASNDSLRKILWPHGQGTRKELSVERDIDLILQGGSR